MRLIDQVYLTNLQTLFGPTATIEDVKVTNETVEFSLPIDQKQQFPHGVAVEIIGIYDGKLDCSMTEAELTTQLHFVDALRAASAEPSARGYHIHQFGPFTQTTGWAVNFKTADRSGRMDPTPPPFCDTRLPQLIAADNIQRQAKQERDNWNERQKAKNNQEV